MATDREIFKAQQMGALATAPAISDAKATVRASHTRVRDFRHTGTENADTNVGENVVLAFIPVATKLRGVGIAVTTAIAANATDYAHITFYKRLSGTSTLIGSWNTHTSAQGALVTSSPSEITVGAGLIVNTDSDIAAGSSITMIISKYGAGQDVNIGTCFSFELEEV